MMKRLLSILFVGLMLGLMSVSVSAQDKTNAYYDSHPTEILPDAQTAFRNGDYDRTVELCRLHYAVVGDNRADDLKEKATQCAKLTIEMNAFYSIGQQDAASEKAREILAINPDDKNAKSKVAVSFDEIGEYYSLDIALARRGNKWGAIDREKNIVVPIIYDQIGPFAYGEFGRTNLTTCMARRDGKTVFVNMHGQEVTPDNLYYAIRGIELDTPNLYYLVYKYNSPEVYVDMNGVEYPTEDEAAYGILGLRENNSITSGPYKIGDFYNENGCKGVVFDVDATGMNGKIVSLMNGYEVWADEESPYSTTHIGLFDEDDGESNFRIIKQIRNWMTFFPAFKWCYQLGEGWYLPANNELALIEENITTINEGVRIAGHRPLEIVNVISSTEDRSDPSKVFYIYYGDFQPLDKKYDYHLLAVKKFGTLTGLVSNNDLVSPRISPPRRPSRMVLSKSGSIYCDGVYHGPHWEYDYKTTALYEDLGSQFNRNFFSISFEYYIQNSDEGYDYKYAKNTSLLTLGASWRSFGLKPWNNTIYAATNNYDNYFDTTIRLEFETWQRIDMVYDNGKLYINGRALDIGPLTQSSENILTSVNFSSGLCFKGYIRNLVVKSE